MEFIKWCFKDETSGTVTVFVLVLVGVFVLELAEILTKRKK